MFSYLSATSIAIDNKIYKTNHIHHLIFMIISNGKQQQQVKRQQWTHFANKTAKVKSKSR